MELDERKVKILEAIIRNYLETGEPVGSRTISKYTDLNLSSATIRNEMADLEELGYIIQPHTSAGRIPSDAGYRLYVDRMMKDKMEELENREQKLLQMQDFLIEKVDKVETLLQNVAKTLADNTNYATLVSAPKYEGNRLKFVQLSEVEPGKILAVVVTDTNLVKNKIIASQTKIDNETILKLNLLLNSSLNGLTIEEINLSLISKLTGQAGEYAQLIRDILDAIAELVAPQDELQIYTSGATNIFKYPELSTQSRASELISTFEEKKQLTQLINDTYNKESEGTGIQIYIGNETPVNAMKDCSVVTATYQLDEGVKGTIGIVGPKRMDYEKVVEALNSIKVQLDSKFKDN